MIPDGIWFVVLNKLVIIKTLLIIMHVAALLILVPVIPKHAEFEFVKVISDSKITVIIPVEVTADFN